MPVVTKAPKRRLRIDWLTLFGVAVIGGGLVLAMFLVTCVQGCAAGFTEPDALGNRSVMLGFKAGTLADAGSEFGKLLGDNLGLLLGLGTGGTGLVGLIGAKLVKSWSDQKAAARAAAAAHEAENRGFDEGAARAGPPTVKPS